MSVRRRTIKRQNDLRLPFERPSKGERAGVLELDDVRGIVQFQGLVFTRRARGSRTGQQCFGEWICASDVSEIDRGAPSACQSPVHTRHFDSVELLLLGDDAALAIVNRPRAIGEVDHSSSWVRRIRCEEEGE